MPNRIVKAKIGEKSPNIDVSEWVQGLPTNIDQEKDKVVKDVDYFVKLLVHPDYVVRTRSTCILVDFGGEDKVQYVAQVLKNDENELVRHEAAFSLGQMCYSSGIKPLADATLNDPSIKVFTSRYTIYNTS